MDAEERRLMLIWGAVGAAIFLVIIGGAIGLWFLIDGGPPEQPQVTREVFGEHAEAIASLAENGTYNTDAARTGMAWFTFIDRDQIDQMYADARRHGASGYGYSISVISGSQVTVTQEGSYSGATVSWEGGDGKVSDGSRYYDYPQVMVMGETGWKSAGDRDPSSGGLLGAAEGAKQNGTLVNMRLETVDDCGFLCGSYSTIIEQSVFFGLDDQPLWIIAANPYEDVVY